MSALLAVLDAHSGELLRKRPRCLAKGQSGTLVLTLERCMALERCAVALTTRRRQHGIPLSATDCGLRAGTVTRALLGE